MRSHDFNFLKLMLATQPPSPDVDTRKDEEAGEEQCMVATVCYMLGRQGNLAPWVPLTSTDPRAEEKRS
jgi:hypothetical protein